MIFVIVNFMGRKKKSAAGELRAAAENRRVKKAHFCAREDARERGKEREREREICVRYKRAIAASINVTWVITGNLRGEERTFS